MNRYLAEKPRRRAVVNAKTERAARSLLGELDTWMDADAVTVTLLLEGVTRPEGVEADYPESD